MRTMTAYAYIRRVKKEHSLEIIVKSFNSKYLDIAIYHLPPEKVILEKKIRELIEKSFSQGKDRSIYISKILKYSSAGTQSEGFEKLLSSN